MSFKYFRFKIVLRVLFIGLMMLIVIYSFNQDKWYVTSAVATLITLILLVELIYFTEAIKRELSKFLLSIKHKDFTTSYTTGTSKKDAFPELKQAFTEIKQDFQDVRIEKELHYQYLQTVFEHAKSAIICYEPNGDIQLINEAAKQLLQIKKLKTFDEIKNINSELYQLISNCEPDQEVLAKITLHQNLYHLNLQCSIFKLQDKSYKLISLHNIQNALEEQEMESWKKLIRILNHEIMNSVTPISSLSSAMNKMLRNEDGEKKALNSINADDADDLFDSIETIESRSKGLLKFVTAYKQLSKLPKPTFAEVNINGLIKHITTLLKPEFKKHQIKVSLPSLEKDLILKIDHEMIEQVLINLILNSIQAIKDKANKSIEIEAYTSNNSSFVRVTDNGPGIEAEVLDNIFIPFFTTKKNGSGIGLSLSRQIMRLHKGNIQVHTEVGKGSSFLLKF